MGESSEVDYYLATLLREVEGLAAKLPLKVEATASIRGRSVYLEVRGPRSATFTIVLGSEAPEIVYDGQYIHHHLIGPGMDDQLDFIEESLDEIAGFVLRDTELTRGKTRILRKPYVSMPLSDGIEWRLHQFH
ncbi:hypothetical protein [Micrococcus terreus]|uniref:hypothetical protein n=1 Tax=Micrococcus terreus TaxID=574650 RepID=UPI00301842B5